MPSTFTPFSRIVRPFESTTRGTPVDGLGEPACRNENCRGGAFGSADAGAGASASAPTAAPTTVSVLTGLRLVDIPWGHADAAPPRPEPARDVRDAHARVARGRARARGRAPGGVARPLAGRCLPRAVCRHRRRLHAPAH